MSILNELTIESGQLKVEGRTLLCSTRVLGFYVNYIKRNILFGAEFDEQKIQ